MPYRREGRVIYSKSGGDWHVKQRCKSVAAAKRALKLLRAVEHGWEPTGKKKKSAAYARKEDRKMRDFGDVDFDKKAIRVNPKKGGLINSILHEEIHREYPDWTEKKVRREAEKREKSLTLRRAMSLLKKYLK